MFSGVLTILAIPGLASAAGPASYDQIVHDFGVTPGSLIGIGIGVRGVFELNAREDRQVEARAFLRRVPKGHAYRITIKER